MHASAHEYSYSGGNHWGKLMNKKIQKIYIIQSVLQTLNAKFQKKKVPQLIVIKVLCFSTMCISSIAGGAQA